jgi:hypothetical protein
MIEADEVQEPETEQEPNVDLMDLLSKVVDTESKTLELDEKVEGLKESIIKTNEAISKVMQAAGQLIGDLRSEFYKHQLTPDAHNSALVWKTRNDIDKKKKSGSRE